MDERFHELAAAMEQEARDAAVRRAHEATSAKGQSHCDDCEDRIPDERRRAHPAAIRCIDCQTTFEMFSKGNAR